MQKGRGEGRPGGGWAARQAACAHSQGQPAPSRPAHTHTPVGGTQAPWQNPRKAGAGRRVEVSHRPRPQKALCWLILESAAGNSDSGG